MADVVVRFDAVEKHFGAQVAVDRLSFEIRRGEVFALLGPNGAGKTTTVRMLVGMIAPDAGTIEVHLGGWRAGKLPPELSGYLPEERGLYRELSVLRTVVYFGRLRGLARKEADRRAHEWLERLELLDRRHERVDSLSKGNQQRVQLITAVLHRPEVAILDEPFSGLDPLSQERFLELVGELRRDGMTVLLSAHQMDLVERIADRVLVMHRGREILSGAMGELHARVDARPSLRLELAAGADLTRLAEDPDVEEVAEDGAGIHVVLAPGASRPAFLARVAQQFPLEGLSTEAPRLHDVFVRAVRNAEAGRAEAGRTEAGRSNFGGAEETR